MVTFLRGWCCTRRPYLARTNATGSTALSTSAGIDYADLIFVSKTFTRLYRIGAYPPLRGTLMRLDHRQVVLYTRGSVEFFRTYPRMYVPRLLLLRCQEIGQSLGFLAEEILALSKMNWNNTQFDGGEPITVRASRYVGDILTYVPDGQAVAPRYSYYMQRRRDGSRCQSPSAPSALFLLLTIQGACDCHRLGSRLA